MGRSGKTATWRAGKGFVGPDARTVSGLHFMNKNTKCTHKSQGVWGTQIKISDKCYTPDKYRRHRKFQKHPWHLVN